MVLFLSLPCLGPRARGLGVEDVVVRREIASSTHTGQTLEGVHEHAEGGEFFRGNRSEYGHTAEEEPVRLTTVLSECVMGLVTHGAVALAAFGLGVPGVRVPAAGYRGKHVRCVFCDILDVGERRVQLFGVRRGAAILECKLT